jgi:hypothetical protein
MAAAVSGPTDTHCSGKAPQETNPASCHPDAGAPEDASAGDATADDAAASDAGSDDGGGGDAGDGNEFGPTHFNAEADDDDCKYHVAWQSTAVAANVDVMFRITVTRKTDDQLATGAVPYIEAFLGDTPPGPGAESQTEVSPGVYTIGPVQFPVSGQWTVRFHLYGRCFDTLDDSPHGHAAFLVNVP